MINLRNNQSGLTLIEMLVAMVILFVGVALALKLQANIGAALRGDDLDRAILLADSLLLECETSSFNTDTTYTVGDDSNKLSATVSVIDSDGLTGIRVAVNRDGGSIPIHQLYREIENLESIH